MDEKENICKYYIKGKCTIENLENCPYKDERIKPCTIMVGDATLEEFADLMKDIIIYKRSEPEEREYRQKPYIIMDNEPSFTLSAGETKTIFSDEGEGFLFDSKFQSNKSTVRVIINCDSSVITALLSELNTLEVDMPMPMGWFLGAYDTTNHVYVGILAPCKPISYHRKYSMTLENTGSADATIAICQATREIVSKR
jgi:hypothetical protein